MTAFVRSDVKSTSSRPARRAAIGVITLRLLVKTMTHRVVTQFLPYLFACSLAIVCPRTALSRVEGFDESFDGGGSYSTTSKNLSGLDNPGWELETNAGIGTLDGNGYAFQVGVFPVDSDKLWRTVPGRGSFRESVRFSGLDMGWYSEGTDFEGGARSIVRFTHHFPGKSFATGLEVYFDEMLPTLRVNNAVYWETEIVPRFTDFELGIEYHRGARKDYAWYWLDSPETGGLTRGPIELKKYNDLDPLFDYTTTELYLGKHFDGKLSGRLDHWSLEPLPDIRADINDDGVLNTADVDLLSLISRGNGTDAVADLSIDGKVDQTDLGLWIHEHRKSYFGDGNLDGQFNSQDLTLVFQSGQYEDLIEGNSTWATGDWNVDAEFTSSDLVVAFQDGGYEQGPRPAVTTSVPEPSGVWMWIVGFTIAAWHSTVSSTRQVGSQILSMRGRTLACCLAMFLVTQNAHGSNIVGFDESFDGTGPYATISQELTGLDNPNWRLLSEENFGSLDGEGYVFEHRSFPPNGSGWSRNVVGNGSFRQVIRFSQLDVGWWVPDPFRVPGTGYAAANLQGTSTQSYISIIHDPSRPEDEKVLDWGFSTDRGARHEVIPLLNSVEMGIEEDFERNVAWAWIDSPVTGRIVRGPLPFTPYEDSPSYINIRLAVAATGGASYISGRLDHWSLEPLPDIRADINDDGVLNVADIDLMSLIIRRNGTDAVADLSIDGKVDQTDLGLWIHDHRKSYFGDANLDGQFNSQDLTLVFQAGQYEDTIEGNSTWATGDWNADGEFSSSDLVVAFQDRGYEQGPRPTVVPEPSSMILLGLGLLGFMRRHSSFAA